MDKEIAIDDIIIRGDPFDCDEDTSQEDKRIRRGVVSPPSGGGNKNKNTSFEQGAADMTSIDPFTGYVKEILAKTVFRASIPSQPPDKEFDTPELYLDKLNYQRAVAGSKRFKEELFIPLLEKISEQLESTIDANLYEALLKAPRLVAEKTKTVNEPSEWSSFVLKTNLVNLRFIIPKGNVEDVSIRVTPSEAEYLKALHNIFHLEKYIMVVIFDSIKDQKIENYTQAWNVLTTPTYAERPIKDWEDLTFIPFIDYLLSLYKTIEFFLNKSF
jgi:hypothetical protein